VSDDRHVVECRYCRTVLRVERTPSGELERLLIERQQKNMELLAENRRLALTNAIHQLDSDWAKVQKKLMVPRNGGPEAPSELQGWVLLVIGGFLLWAGTQYGFQVAWQTGLGFVAVGVVCAGAGISQVTAGQRYKIAKRQYERRRKQLCEDLAEAERAVDDRAVRQPRYEDTKARRKRLDGMSAYPAADA
jgi:hypothetical protein